MVGLSDLGLVLGFQLDFCTVLCGPLLHEQLV